MNILDQIGIWLMDLPVYLANGMPGRAVLAGGSFGGNRQHGLRAGDGAAAGCRNPTAGRLPPGAQ